MALFAVSGINVSGIAAAVPANTQYNRDLSMLDEGEKDNLITKVGIGSRRIAPSNVCASDLCAIAAKRLFQETNCDPATVGMLVFVTQTPDHLLPGNSLLAQQWLGLSPSTLLLDVNQGCAGYVYGLATITGMMRSCNIETGLLLVGDTITRLLAPEDRTTVPIFSDAGSATLIKRSPTTEKIFFNIGADGAGFNTIHVKHGGARHPIGNDFSANGNDCMHLAMEGLDVLNYSLKNVVPNIKGLLEFAECDIEKVDHFVFHQANRILNENIVRKLGIPASKVPETLSAFGNTSSATIPVTIASRLRETLMDDRNNILISGFGAGFSWGSALLNTQSVICPSLIELHDGNGK